jgi:hypothetical protein
MPIASVGIDVIAADWGAENASVVKSKLCASRVAPPVSFSWWPRGERRDRDVRALPELDGDALCVLAAPGEHAGVRALAEVHGVRHGVEGGRAPVDVTANEDVSKVATCIGRSNTTTSSEVGLLVRGEIRGQVATRVGFAAGTVRVVNEPKTPLTGPFSACPVRSTTSASVFSVMLKVEFTAGRPRSRARAPGRRRSRPLRERHRTPFVVESSNALERSSGGVVAPFRGDIDSLKTRTIGVLTSTVLFAAGKKARTVGSVGEIHSPSCGTEAGFSPTEPVVPLQPEAEKMQAGLSQPGSRSATTAARRAANRRTGAAMEPEKCSDAPRPRHLPASSPTA